MPAKSVAIFVDLFNQYAAVNLVFGNYSRLDYAAYKDRCSEEGTIYRSFAYGIQKNIEAAQFIACLKNMGYETNYIQQQKGNYLTNRTCDMIIDILGIIDRIDVLVLGTNDPSILPIVIGAKARGVKVIIFGASIPAVLKEHASEHWSITENFIGSSTPAQ